MIKDYYNLHVVIWLFICSRCQFSHLNRCKTHGFVLEILKFFPGGGTPLPDPPPARPLAVRTAFGRVIHTPPSKFFFHHWMRPPQLLMYRMRLKKMWCLHRNNLATNRVINTKFSDFIKQPILHSGSKFQANSSNICIVIEILLREHRKQKSTCKHRVAQRLNDVF